MLRRLLYNEAPAGLRELIDDLQHKGDYLIIESEQHQPLACLTPLPDADEARRDEAARKLRELLDSLPATSPYSEEETYQHIEEALAAIRKQAQERAVS